MRGRKQGFQVSCIRYGKIQVACSGVNDVVWKKKWKIDVGKKWSGMIINLLLFNWISEKKITLLMLGICLPMMKYFTSQNILPEMLSELA